MLNLTIGNISGCIIHHQLFAEFRPYRLVFLGLGLVMLMLAPVVSKSVPFYYGSAMAFGIILVILIILFQVLFPTSVFSGSFLFM
jgi:hypothetical protein